MKTFFALFVALCFLASGVWRYYCIRCTSKALCEAVSFFLAVRGEMAFRAPTVEELLLFEKLAGYRYLDFTADSVSLNSFAGKEAVREFSGFVQRLGTTDAEGQLSLCDEATASFREMYASAQKKQNEKCKMTAAFSVFSALAALMLLL